jgi:hypothetical protein
MSHTGQVFRPPTNVTFSNLNLLTGAVATKVGETVTLYVPAATGTNLEGQYVAAPATPYCLIANLVSSQGDYVSASYTAEPVNYGIGFYDGTKLVWIRANWSSSITMGLFVTESATVSAITADVFGNAYSTGQASGLIRWFMIQDDGTNISFYIAMDADNLTQPHHWVKLYSQARTSYLANVNNICWLCDSNTSASSAPNYLTLQSWQTVAL